MRALFRKRDAFLSQPLATERFDLPTLNRWQAFRLSYPWTRDPALMLDLTQSAAPRSPWKWYKELGMPNNRKKFAHAIVPRGGVPIGMHGVRLFGHNSALMYVALHDRSWWDKGVVLEVRSRVINHFFTSGRVERFYAEVNPRNAASVFNTRRLGFKPVGVLHRVRQDPVSKQVFDTAMFELFREDWDKTEWAEKEA